MSVAMIDFVFGITVESLVMCTGLVVSVLMIWCRSSVP